MIVYETVWLVAVGILTAALMHEGGHLLAAFAAGLRPRICLLGLGPEVLRLRRGGLTLILRAVPVTGFVLVEPTDRRWAFVATVAAGPLANALGLATGLHLLATRPTSDFGLALAIYQGLFLLATLIPMRGKVAGLRLASDGLQLYGLLRGGPTGLTAAGYASRLAHYRAKAAPPHPLTRHAGRMSYAFGLPFLIPEDWARREACGSLREMLADSDLTRPERAAILSYLCSLEFVYGATGMSLEEVDRWSTETLDLAPEPIARDGRGGALLILGRRGEAEAMLRAALDGYAARREGDSLQAALCRATLARTVALTGRVGEARHLWEMAETAPAVAAYPLAKGLLSRIKSRALPDDRALPVSEGTARPDPHLASRVLMP